MGLIQEIMGTAVDSSNVRTSKRIRSFMIFIIVSGLVTAFALLMLLQNEDSLTVGIIVISVLIYTLVTSWLIWLTSKLSEEQEKHTDYLEKIARLLEHR
jgi:ABC-type Fe3+ transport system permease subunit